VYWYLYGDALARPSQTLALACQQLTQRWILGRRLLFHDVPLATSAPSRLSNTFNLDACPIRARP
jgi:hypothetical protein